MGLFTKRKIIKYLNSVDEKQYSVLDDAFQKYLDGELQNSFQEKGFTQIEIFPYIKKKEKSIHVYFKHGNFAGDVEFNDTYLDYVVYRPGISAEEYENGIVRLDYTEDFTLERFIEILLCRVNADKN